MIRIRELREAKGIQQKELAIDLCVSQPTVSDWESGRKIPSAKSTLKLADYFGVSIDYLLGREELSTFFCEDGWHNDQTQDYNRLNSDDLKRRFLAINGYDKDHAPDAERLFPTQFQKKEPTPAPEDGQNINIIKIAGRDGSHIERKLTDEQMAALKLIIDQLPDATDL